ncbi:hypothetical protein EDC01DRAFT_732465 [Geopyxis carbonaria]|nr:hypothetical protein EDC01DRAFT_732465 [Geopyxis carbonaria]
MKLYVTTTVASVVQWTTFAGEVLFTLIRFYETRNERMVTGSNAFIVLGLAASLAVAVISTWILHQPLITFGANNFLKLVYPGFLEDWAEMLKMAFAVQFVFYTSLYAVKASFLCMYYRLFTSESLRSRLVFFAGALYVCTCWTATILLLALWCRPIATNYNSLFDGCSPFLEFPPVVAVAAMNISSDLVVMCLPLVVIARLVVTQRSTKIAVVLIVAMGVVSVVASVIKLVMQLILIGDGYSGDGPAARTSWSVGMWFTVETWAAYTAACLPALRKRLVFRWGGGEAAQQPGFLGSLKGVVKSWGSRTRTATTATATGDEEAWELTQRSDAATSTTRRTGSNAFTVTTEGSHEGAREGRGGDVERVRSNDRDMERGNGNERDVERGVGSLETHRESNKEGAGV